MLSRLHQAGAIALVPSHPSLWLSRYPIERIVGHRDLDPSKACPSFDATLEALALM